VRLPLFLLTVGGGTLVQCVLGPAVSIGGVVPDIPVVVVVLLALRRGSEAGCLVGFALGVIQDVLAGGPLGLHAVSKALIGFVAGDLPRLFLVSRPLVPVTAALLATVADGTIRFALLQLFHYPAPFGELLSRVIVPQAGYNAALATVALVVPAIRARA
jgi:rod shape-determining protein MreD